MAVFRSDILIISEEAKVLVPTHQKTTKAPHSHCFIGRDWHQMDQVGHYLAQNDQKCIFWANIGRFWANNPNLFSEGGKSFGTNISKKPTPK